MYYVIDWFNPDCPSFAMTEDGEILTFDTKEKAQLVADEYQDGEVIER